MIWNCGKEVGEMGIEIIPCAPTITDELDNVGKQLVVGLIDWIEWIADKTGRKEILELAKTGGQERNKERKGMISYKPSFVKIDEKVRKVGAKELKRYNLELIKGERREVIEYMPSAPEEIRELLERRGKNMREDEEERLTRICTDNGISVESEYTFSTAVGRFTQIAKDEGRFKGKVIKNVAEQLKMRARFEGVGKVKKSVLVIGASEAGRMVEELERIGDDILVISMIRIRGEVNEEKVEQVVEEARLGVIAPDKIVIFGPGNSQSVHGKPENRGKGPERKIVYNEEGEIKVEYHMTEPAKISMGEKEKIVGLMEYMVDELRKDYQGSDILYVGLMPRHIERCCTEKSHMEGEDIVMLHGSRREFDRQVKNRLGEKVEIVEWFEALGLEMEPGLREIREMQIVGSDGVHLEKGWNRKAAISMARRLMEEEVVVVSGERESKKIRK
jgi:hypothetical protein